MTGSCKVTCPVLRWRRARSRRCHDVRQAKCQPSPGAARARTRVEARHPQPRPPSTTSEKGAKSARQRMRLGHCSSSSSSSTLLSSGPPRLASLAVVLLSLWCARGAHAANVTALTGTWSTGNGDVLTGPVRPWHHTWTLELAFARPLTRVNGKRTDVWRADQQHVQLPCRRRHGLFLYR